MSADGLDGEAAPADVLSEASLASYRFGRNHGRAPATQLQMLGDLLSNSGDRDGKSRETARIALLGAKLRRGDGSG